MLERLRDGGPVSLPLGRDGALVARLRRLGYICAGPWPGSVAITERGVLSLTPLE